MDEGDLGARRARGAAQLRRQSGWCGELGSPLYAALLTAAAADCAAGGPSWAVIEGHEDASVGWALALRFAGAVHRLVLEGAAPDLARHYPSAGGAPRGGEDVWPAFRAVLEEQRETLRALLPAPVQTNEVARSASLLGGFATVAQESRLPLRLLEVGASAGLNLRFDHFRYESDGFAWGDPAATVRLRGVFEGAAPRFEAPIQVIERAGCDAEPVDPSTAAGRLTLRAFLWPDQLERRARLDAALELAGRVPAAVERADALDWAARRLAPSAGAATVFYHSIVMGYLGREGTQRLVETVRAAGARASSGAPLAWLRLEPARRDDGEWEHRVTLTSWPGGEDRLLATSSAHGPPVRWRAPQ